MIFGDAVEAAPSASPAAWIAGERPGEIRSAVSTATESVAPSDALVVED